MVAKINVGSSLFGALAYNQQKIDKSEGRVLYSHKMRESEDGRFDIHRCMIDFDRQMPKEFKTEKPVIHISLNPHPDDKLSDDQLAVIAQEYLEKLGYGNQPYMVYKHEDIARHHIHIVSLRIDETGRKINDKFEYRRSKDITRELEQKYNLHSAEKASRPEHLSLKKVDSNEGDVKQQISNTLKALSGQYHFQSMNEYRALLSIYNIHTEEIKGEVQGKPYNGLVYFATNNAGSKTGNPFKSSLFGKSVGYNAIQECSERSKEIIKDKQLKKRTKQSVATAMRQTTNRSDFEKELLKDGIDVVVRQNDAGRIYGITFIDHNTKCVLNGSRLGKEFSANAFNERFNSSHEKPEMPLEKDSFGYAVESSNQPDREKDTFTGDVFNLFSVQSHGADIEEEAFIHRMRRKRKKLK
jgi:hypothetical protein